MLAVMPRKPSHMGTVQKERKNLATVPKPCDRNFDIPPEYHNFIFFDSGVQDERIIVFGHPDLVGMLNRAPFWFIDGTSDVAPTIYH